MRSILIVAAFALAGCASGPTPDSPKSNLFARANIMSANDKSITIRHSQWGEATAFRWASDHCAKFSKSAVPAGSSYEYGPDVTTTWRCE